MNDELKIKELKKTLLGRIKLNFAREITKSNNNFPSKNQMIKYFKKSTENNSIFWAYLLNSIFTQNRTFPISYADIITSKGELEETFSSLESNFTEDIINFSVFDCPKPLPEEVIVWIIKHVDEKLDKRYGIIIGDERLHEEIIASFFLSKKKKEKVEIFLLESNLSTYEKLDKNNQQILLELGIKCFIGCNIHLPFSFIQTNKIKEKGKISQLENEKYNPPSDSKLMQYLFELKNNKRLGVKALVDIDYIELGNFDFAYLIPEQMILNHLKHIDKINNYGILTYEYNGKLIVSDDYFSYLAIRVEELKTITVVNLGEFEKVKPISILKRGGIEILPPVITEGTSNLSKEYKIARIEEKIKIIKKLNVLKKSIANDFISIKTDIANNKLEKVFISLEELTLGFHLNNQLVALKGRFSKLHQDIGFGIIEKQNEIIELNRIRRSLIEILKSM